MTTPMIRQAPSGPRINSLKNGAVIQFDNALTVVTNGTITPGSPLEVQANMSNATPTLRPELENPNPTSRIFVEGDLDIVFDDVWVSQDLTSSVEVSLNNGSSWTPIGGSVMLIPASGNGVDPGTRNRLHFKVSSPIVPISVLPGFDPAALDTVLARVTLERDPTTGVATVVTDSAVGTVRLGIWELYSEA